MAHECPNCYQLCHCEGDIDDINFGEWIGCRCNCEDEDEAEKEYDDYDDDFYDGEINTPASDGEKEGK